MPPAIVTVRRVGQDLGLGAVPFSGRNQLLYRATYDCRCRNAPRLYRRSNWRLLNRKIGVRSRIDCLLRNLLSD